MDESTSLLTETAADTTQSAEAQTTAETTDVAAAPATPTETPEVKPEVKAEEVKKEEAKPEGAPEAYEDFAKPEGVELDTEVLGDLKVLAKELNLPQAQAQKVVDLGVKLQQKQAEAWQAQIEKWVGDVKSDKDIGGDKLPENLGIARKAIDTFAPPELKELLNSSGLGNHPLMIKTFLNIGKAISEDGFVTGSKTAGTKQSLESRLYGNSNKV
jgi:hypothetical protein